MNRITATVVAGWIILAACPIARPADLYVGPAGTPAIASLPVKSPCVCAASQFDPHCLSEF